jgi:chromate transporter
MQVPASAESPIEATVPPASPLELFLAFAGLSLQAFGGAVAHIERTVVRRKRWLTSEEFLGLYGISQVLPGPTGISFCVLFGHRLFGLRGALATVGGFLLLPAVIVLAIASLFQQYHHLPQVQGALHGMGAAAVGVIASAALRLGRNLRGNRAGIFVALVAFAAVGLARLPVAWLVMSVGVLSVLWAWRSLGRKP